MVSLSVVEVVLSSVVSSKAYSRSFVVFWVATVFSSSFDGVVIETLVVESKFCCVVDSGGFLIR